MYIELKTERLLLCPISTKYLLSTHEYASDIENTKYMENLPNKTIDETRHYLEGAEKSWNNDIVTVFEFALISKDGHIGAVGLYLDTESKDAEIGWIINARYHNMGYMSEAVKEVIRFAFENLGLKSVYAKCDQENKASERVMQKVGIKMVSNDTSRIDRKTGISKKEYRYSIKRE